jgi:hypothetical protein
LSDGGSEADRRRWTHKRAQFDNAIHSARLLGFIQKLANGQARHQDILRTLLEVNASADQSQYVAETLAMKKEVRGLARLDFHPEVAVFFTQASRLIPKLTDGLASQIMMLLGHAAQNDAYLDTVSNAVSELLADLDRPLSREARNYLRLLWDQMEATRRLKQTEALFPGSSMPPPSAGAVRELRDSGKLPKAGAHADPTPAPSAPENVAEELDLESLNKTAKMDVPGGARAAHAAAAESSAAAAAPPEDALLASTLMGVGPGQSAAAVTIGESPAANRPPAVGERAHDRAWDEQTTEFFNRSDAPQPESARDSTRDWRPAPISQPPLAAKRDPDVKLPTNSVPRWAVISASVVVAGVVAAVVYVTREPEPEEPTETSATASARAPAPSGSALGAATKSSDTKPALPQLPAAPPPPPPPQSVTPTAEPLKSVEPRRPVPSPAVVSKASDHTSKPASARVAVDSPSVHVQAPAKTLPSTASTAPKVAASAESQTHRTSATVVTPPEIAKNLSPLDRIVAELRLISPDTVGIEEKARELSRIIATSKRKDAFYIIDHLGPPIALDALGRDPVLEESLRTFAISTLGRVALDDDDSRAVSAIFMLGEWAKSGGKGRQKAISALESLSKDRIIKSSAPRIKALRAARAEIE